MSLTLEYFKLDTDTQPVYAGGHYAIVFDKNHAALKLVTPPVYSLAAYTFPTHDDFAIALPEHAHRTKVFTTTIADANLSLPANGLGEAYTVEIWGEAVAAVQDRTVDKLLRVYTVNWTGSRLTDFRNANLYVACGYNHTVLRLGILAWLELNGQLVINPTAIEVNVYDSSDTLLFTINDTVPDSQGQYNLEKTALTLAPDEVYLIKCAITAGGVVYTNATVMTTWD